MSALGKESSSILATIRQDLKTAMRAKDAVKLTVLRGLLAEVTNAAKTNTPLESDSQVINMIRKQIKSSEIAAKEAEQAQRADLHEKERQNIVIMNNYIKDVPLMSMAEVRSAVTQVIDGIKHDSQRLEKGVVMKKLLGPGGILESSPVDKKEVASVVQSML